MPTVWYTCKVEDILIHSDGIRRFFLRVKGDAVFTWTPGQFITFDLPVGEKRLHRWKSYSIANTPNTEGLIELCIVRHADGLGTGYLFEETSIGTELIFKGPEGSFVLPEKLDKKRLVMVCTGTGVAPFRSMIQAVTDKGITFKQIHLIFGARRESDILYRDEFEALAKSHPNFIYDVVLSRQEDWPGHRGYVHDVYLDGYKQDDRDIIFMLCGWTRMIDEAVVNLITKIGFDRSQVRYELYG